MPRCMLLLLLLLRGGGGGGGDDAGFLACNIALTWIEWHQQRRSTWSGETRPGSAGSSP